jgi:molecular chaperone DnaK
MNIPVSVFLKATAKETARRLGDILPTIGGTGWWKTCVVAKLSVQQQQRLENAKITKLEDLDIAALMRVLDRNWFEIAEKAGYPSETKTLVHEIIEIRHRWAHEGAAKDQADEDLYRDLDHLYRYLIIIKADGDLLERLQTQRKEVLARLVVPSVGRDSSGNTPEAPPEPPLPEPPTETTPPPAPPTRKPQSRGVPLKFLGREARDNKDIRALLASTTYIGIDFGTSTTTASRVIIDEESGTLAAEPIPIKQYDENGACTRDHLVPSCIAWTGSALLVGQGAARLKSQYEYGRNIWFSFKMKLGIDLGPQYYRSELSRGKGPCVIEKPQQAAAVFFRYLREEIQSYIREQKLPENVVYSVSVPAAFEANQRKDLCDALAEAGITLPPFGIIDEPNAAFISYLLDTLQIGAGIAEAMKQGPRNILVFDFGAGTCDISILQVSAVANCFISKNLAISQFHALGGDNMDRQLVREILWPLMFEHSKPTADFSTGDIDVAIIPRLQQAAENMKIQCCKFITTKWDGQNLAPFATKERTVTGAAIPPFKVRGCDLSLPAPTMSYFGFAEVMKPFVDPKLSNSAVVHREDDVVSVFEPIDNALGKAELDDEDLHMVLFIGGSSANPYVQSAVIQRFGRFVECVVPGDLRTPVSRGAALNSFIVNGLKCEVIKPITSEPIYVVTAGGGLHEIMPAGTEMPSAPMFVQDLVVQNDDQHKVELPICVSNEKKLLGTVEITAPPSNPFKKGQSVTLSCQLDENKLINITAKTGSRMVNGTLLNPLSNEALTHEEARMLMARQAVNLSALENKGRPAVAVMLNYAYACAEADHYVQAAEAFEAVERLDTSCDFATNICFHYSRAGKRRLSDRWADLAYQRKPNPISAFNLALSKQSQGDLASFEKLMEEAITMNPQFASALEIYGHYLKEKALPKGVAMVQIAFDKFKEAFDKETLDEDDFGRLQRAARTVGRNDVADRVECRRRELGAANKGFNEANLVASTRKTSTKLERK